MAQLSADARVRRAVLSDRASQATGERMYGFAQVGHARRDVLALVRAVSIEVAASAAKVSLERARRGNLLPHRNLAGPAVALGAGVLGAHVVGVESVLTE